MRTHCCFDRVETVSLAKLGRDQESDEATFAAGWSQYL